MIIQNNENALRVKCEDVLPEEINEIILKLEQELDRSFKLGEPGIGLAAPQIGINKRAAIIRCGEYKLDLINPSIIETYDKGMFKGEGCLSFPGREENTFRYQEIVLNNNNGEPRQYICTGLVAVCCQHEIEHLDGILFFDNVIKKKKLKPNDLCNCGKLDKLTNLPKKYKKCCGEK